MFWPRCVMLLSLAVVAQAESQGYLLGAGLESASLSEVEIPLRGNSDMVYADIDLDHRSDIELGVGCDDSELYGDLYFYGA